MTALQVLQGCPRGVSYCWPRGVLQAVVDRWIRCLVYPSFGFELQRMFCLNCMILGCVCFSSRTPSFFLSFFLYSTLSFLYFPGETIKFSGLRAESEH